MSGTVTIIVPAWVYIVAFSLAGVGLLGLAAIRVWEVLLERRRSNADPESRADVETAEQFGQRPQEEN